MIGPNTCAILSIFFAVVLCHGWVDAAPLRYASLDECIQQERAELEERAERELEFINACIDSLPETGQRGCPRAQLRVDARTTREEWQERLEAAIAHFDKQRGLIRQRCEKILASQIEELGSDGGLCLGNDQAWKCPGGSMKRKVIKLKSPGYVTLIKGNGDANVGKAFAGKVKILVDGKKAGATIEFTRSTQPFSIDLSKNPLYGEEVEIVPANDDESRIDKIWIYGRKGQ